jgi:hypothetical protein
MEQMTLKWRLIMSTLSPVGMFSVSCAAVALLALPIRVSAGTVSLPYTFQNGNVADADQVNANFAAVKSAVDGNAAQITALAAGATITVPGTTTCPGGFSPLYSGQVYFWYSQADHGALAADARCWQAAPTPASYASLYATGDCIVCLPSSPMNVLMVYGTATCPSGLSSVYAGKAYVWSSLAPFIASDGACWQTAPPWNGIFGSPSAVGDCVACTLTPP